MGHRVDTLSAMESGTRLGPYEIQEQLGAGGMGEVARVDIGCHGDNYGADVGRTLPVDGRFSPA
jgi:hypothetical protein